MNKETLIRACGWVMWIAVGAMLAIALMGFQSRPIVPDAPEITVYRIDMEDGTQMKCAVVDWRFQVALDCNWP